MSNSIIIIIYVSISIPFSRIYIAYFAWGGLNPIGTAYNLEQK